MAGEGGMVKIFIKRLREKIFSLTRSSKIEIEENVKYLEAKNFARAYRPKESVDYGWVIDYAKAHNEMLLSAKRVNDSKADSLIRFLTAGVGVLGVATISQGEAMLTILLIPAFIFAIWAIIEASSALRPEDYPFPPSVKFALETSDHFHDASQSVAYLAAAIEMANKGLVIGIERKAKCVKLAVFLSLVALVIIVVVIELVAVLRLIGWA